MQAELIIIGDELLNGKVQDKNVHIFSSFCYENQIDLLQVHFIKDDPKAFHQVLKLATTRSKLVVMSGGLGPTKDDITKKMLANFFKKEISYSQEAYNTTKDQYHKKNKTFDPHQNDYANIPKGFIPLYNPTGFAPGLAYITEKEIIFATPGVPHEFKSMLLQSIKPKITSPKKFTKHITIKTAQIPESQIFQDIDVSLWDKLAYFGKVSSLPHPMGVDIGITIQDPTHEEIVIKIFKDSPVNKFIWHIGPEQIEEVIINKAKEKKLTFGFAESCTGGLCSSRITDIPGSSSVFWGSIVSYANDVKIKSLNVDEETIQKHGAVSTETAREMAIGAKESLNVDIVITTTGITGPAGGSKEKPIGTVAIGCAHSKNANSKIYKFYGERQDLKFKFSQVALFTLLDCINKY